MSTNERRIPTVQDVRNSIENITNRAHRYALMYQFLTGAEISELCETKYAPKRNNSHKIVFDLLNEKYQAVLFIITNIKPEERGVCRACAIPLDSTFEPWAKPLYDYFREFGDEYPFQFTRRSHSRYVREAFDGFVWQKADSSGRRKKVQTRTTTFRSADLRMIRMKNLKEFYRFSERDLALFGAWNEYPRDPLMIKEIEDIFTREININDVETFSRLSEAYFPNLLKPINLLDKEQIPFYLQDRFRDDLNKRFDRTLNICTLVRNIHEGSQAKLGVPFFKENMRIVLAMLSPCETEEKFVSKIAYLSALFDIELKPWRELTHDERERIGSIRLIESWLNKSNIIYNPETIQTLDYIVDLRNMEPIHYTDPKKLKKILDFFGIPLTYPREYSILWDAILERFQRSLYELREIINQLP